MAKTEPKKVNLYTVRYKNSMQPIDWIYYTKFYPNKAQAIQQLRLDTGLSLSEGKDVIDEIFARVERGEVEKLPSNMESTYQKPRNSSNEGLKTAGKTTGCCLFGIFYIFFGVIFKLTSSYSKKR